MPGVSLQSDFTAGELSPALSARVELAKYSKGCRTLKNFLVQSHGGAVKRPGFELLDALPGPAVLVPFVFNQEQAYCLVLGEKWLRVATHEGFVLNGNGGTYQIASPYTLTQARQLSYVQSADVLFIACHGVRPQKLKRLAHNRWEFEGMTFTAPLQAPAWDDFAAAENQVFQQAYAANTLYSRNGSGWNIRYELIAYELYRKLDPAWSERYFALAFSGNAYTITEIWVPGDSETGGYWDTRYDPVNENLYRRTGSGAALEFVNGATMSDGAASPAQLTTPYTYYVTAVNAEGKESPLSIPGNITGPASNNWQGGDYIRISWNGVQGAVEYRVYKASFGGRPAYVATSVNLSWNDYNTLASLSEGPPEYVDPFPDGDYPGAVCLFEQRLVFASSPNRPQTIWMSKSGDYGNFAEYTPIAADSPMDITIAGSEVSAVQWMVALRSLILGSAGVEWEVSGRGEAAFSATNKKAAPQSYWGSSLKQAMIIGNVILHVSSSGSQVRSLQYEFAADSYGGMDLSIMAAHLLERERIMDWTYQKNPDSIIWAVRSDGVLLGLTYQAEHQIAAWHRHETQGKFRAVCSIPHGFEYSLFAVVEREAGRMPAAAVSSAEGDGLQGGLLPAAANEPEGSVRTGSADLPSSQEGMFYLERMAERYRGGGLAGMVFLDAALTYRGYPTKSLSGLEHLNDKVVGILADGAVMAPRAVHDGRITLDYPASVVTVGLPYLADLETMPVEISDQGGSSVSLKKQINAVNVIFQDSLGVKAGLSFDRMDEVKWRTSEPYGTPPAPFSGMKSVPIGQLADNVLTVCLRSDLPTPVTVLALVSRIKVNA